MIRLLKSRRSSGGATIMIEIRSKIHTTRIFADRVRRSDIFKLVCYFSYHGDIARVPWYYKRERGESAVSDLSKPIEAIVASMKANTRNEIRRAAKEGCKFDLVTKVEEFVPFYNAFCDSKGLNDRTSVARLSKYQNLLLTKVSHNGQVLAMHANVLDPVNKVALLILSGSQRLDAHADRKMIGWGNRYLHFKELEYLKSHGYKSYDWSGVVTDPQNPLYAIGQFKLAFGGDLVDSWVLQSPLYRLSLVVRNLIIKFRK